MNQCKCIKLDTTQCTRQVSKTQNANTNFCWQHQTCKKSVGQKKTIIKKNEVDLISAKKNYGTEIVASKQIKKKTGIMKKNEVDLIPIKKIFEPEIHSKKQIKKKILVKAPKMTNSDYLIKSDQKNDKTTNSDNLINSDQKKEFAKTIDPDNLIKSNQKKEFAKILFEKGVVVLPVFNKNEIAKWNKQFKESLLAFREYNNPTLNTIYVYGTLGSLGNPSSFHNPFVRQLRMYIMSEANPLFRSLEFLGGKHRNLEQLFDRMGIRKKGTKTQSENWHRDVYSYPFKGDDIFGGWINLDVEKSQYFSCVPGTHKDQITETGFAKIKEEDIKKYQTSKQLIEIPPGHWIIFYQQLVHEVIPRKMTDDSYRSYIGFRLTESNQSLYEHKDTIQNQGVPQFLPGGMAIKMYANLNIAYQLNQLIEWSKIFKEKCLQEKISKKTGKTYKIVAQQMKSLKEYGFPLYETYSIEEKKIMSPQKIID